MPFSLAILGLRRLVTDEKIKISITVEVDDINLRATMWATPVALRSSDE